MTTFVINLRNIKQETQKLASQLEYAIENEIPHKIINFDLQKIIEELKSFGDSFISMLNENVEINSEDIYGNTFRNPTLYNYAEITYNVYPTIEKIRLLGVNPENLQRIRYFVSNISNPFTPTVMNLVENIREINKSPELLNLEELLSCKRDAWNKDSEILSGRTVPKYRYTWKELEGFFIPKPIYDDGTLEDAEIKKIEDELKNGGSSSSQVASNLEKIQDNKKRLEEKSDSKIEKSESPLEWIERNLSKAKEDATVAGEAAGDVILQFLDKFSLGCLIQDALACIKPKNLSCKDLFKDIGPGELMNRIMIAFPQGTDTLQQIERVVQDSMLGTSVTNLRKEVEDLELWIEEDELLLKSESITEQEARNLINAIEEKRETIKNKKAEIKENLKERAEALDLEEEQMSAFSRGGNLATIFSSLENPNNITITNAVMAAIDTIIPFENICEAITNALSFSAQPPFVNFEGLPAFELPEPKPPSDPFAGFAIEISEVFLSVILETLLTMVQNIISDLVNCDNLDAFIAGILEEDDMDFGAIFSGDAVSQNLKKLFGQDTETLTDIVDRNYEQFIGQYTSLPLERSAALKGVISGSDKVIPIGLDAQGIRDTFNPQGKPGFDLQALAAASERTALQIAMDNSNISSLFLQESALQAQSKWVIDSTGTKFEIETGTQIFNLQDIDKFLNSLSQERIEELRRQGTITPRALADAKGDIEPILEQPAIQQGLTNNGKIAINEDDKLGIQVEIRCVFQNLGSVLAPSQFLRLLSSSETQETRDLAYEVAQICEIPILNSLFPTQNLFINMIYSFGKLSGLDSLHDEVQTLVDSDEVREITKNSKCGPYNTVDDFREDLMARVIDEEAAANIMKEVRDERKKKYNQTMKQLLDLGKGKGIDEALGQNSFLADAIKRNLPRNQAEQEAQQEPTTPGAEQQEKKSPIDTVQQKKSDLVQNSAVLQDMFNVLVDSIFLPIQNVFIEDIRSLSEAFSDLEEVNEPIQRQIEMETGVPFFPKAKVINPDFQRKIDLGLVPIIDLDDKSGYAKMVDKSLIATETFPPKLLNDLAGGSIPPLFTYMVDDPAGNKDTNNTGVKYRISGEEGKKYTERGSNGASIPPIQNLVNKRVVGSGVAKNLSNLDLETEITNESLSVEINGSLEELEDKYLYDMPISDEFKEALSDNRPSWFIGFSEVKQNNDRYTSLSVQTEGFTLTTLNGVEKFFFNTFQYATTLQISDEINHFLSSRYSNPNKSRKEVFDEIIIRNLLPLVKKEKRDTRAHDIFAKDFENNSLEIYKEVVETYIRQLMDGTKSNRLLKAVPDTSGITLLESLDFVDCNDIIGIRNIGKDFTSIYQKIKEEPLNIRQRRGEERRPSRVAKSSKIVLTKVLIKIICLDFILKALPAIDYFKFSRDIFTSNLMLNVLCKFVMFEIERISSSKAEQNSSSRINFSNFILRNIIDFFNIKLEDGTFQEIPELEKKQHVQAGFEYPIELKKAIEKFLPELLDECKKVVELPEESDDYGQDELLKTILDSMKKVDIHDYMTVTEKLNSLEPFNTNQDGQKDSLFNTIQKAKNIRDSGLNVLKSELKIEKDIFYPLSINKEFVIQKFVRLPKINRNSPTVKGNPDYFTDSKIRFLESLGPVSISKAKRILNDVYRDNNSDPEWLYICDHEKDKNKKLFETPPEFGIRLCLVKKRKKTALGLDEEDAIRLNNKSYPLSSRQKVRNKLGIIKEEKEVYDIYEIAQEALSINARIKTYDFVIPNNDLGFENEHLPKLLKLLQEDTEVNLILGYAVPIKELISIFLLHYVLSSNSKKMKYLFEPTKKKIYTISEYLENVGDTTLSSARLREITEKQRKEQENVGNPAGPINPEALKMFLRTPIHILKSLAIIADPNVAITDKVVRALTIAQQILPLPEDIKRIPIPYSLTSLALLPAPIFGGLIPAIPPLTAYNITFPAGPIFLALEPLLWDLPWFTVKNREVVTGKTKEEPC